MPTIEGSCVCGAVHWRFEGIPVSATVCNCSACRRHGNLTAYGYEGHEISVSGSTRAYTRDADVCLEFHFCPVCGCYAFWRGTTVEPDGRRRIAVNLRLATDPPSVYDVPVKRFDGRDTWESAPADGRHVRDYWF
jgi:hypothetical protein